MTMATIWTKAKGDAARLLGEERNGAQLARQLLAGFSGGLGKKLEAFEAATKLADMQKTAQRARETMSAYKKHLDGMRGLKLGTASKGMLDRTRRVLDALDEMIKKRVAKLHQATGNAEMVLGSMRQYWQLAKKAIETNVKASRDKADIAGMRSMLAEFDGGLGKELQVFESSFPDLQRMKASKARIAQLIDRYRASIQARQRVANDEEPNRGSDHRSDEGRFTDRLGGGHQRQLIGQLTKFQDHINKLVDTAEKQAAEAWLRQPVG